MEFKHLWSYFVKIFIFSVAILSSKAQAETLLFYEDYWPFSYIENAQTKGLYYDLATSIFDSMEKDYSVEVYPFKRSLMLSMSGKGLVVGIFKTDERSIELEFSEPFYQEESVLFVNKDNKFPFNAMSDLKGRQIGVKLGWSYGAEFDQAKESKLFTTVVGSTEQIYRLLELGRLDAVVDNKLSGISTINDLKVNQSIDVLPKPLVIGGIHIAAKKGLKSELLKQFNRHVSRIRDNGEYHKILNRYYLPTKVPSNGQ